MNHIFCVDWRRSEGYTTSRQNLRHSMKLLLLYIKRFMNSHHLFSIGILNLVVRVADGDILCEKIMKSFFHTENSLQEIPSFIMLSNTMNTSNRKKERQRTNQQNKKKRN